MDAGIPSPFAKPYCPKAMSNPFAILGIDPVFSLSLPALERRQRELNRALHPDQHSSSGSGQRRQALSRAMDINQAYRTLRDPALRAGVLLELLGAPPEGSRSNVSPPEFLMEMMTQREQLDQARLKRDARTIGVLAEVMAEREMELITQLTEAFGVLQEASRQARLNSSEATGQEDPEAFKKAFDRLTELRYVRRFRDEVRVIEDEF